MLCGVRLDDDSLDGAGTGHELNFVELPTNSKFGGNFCRIALAFGSSALVAVATTQSTVYFSEQNLHYGFQAVVCVLAALAHFLTVVLVSRTSFTSNKTNFFVGCLTSTLSTGLLVPALRSSLGINELALQRIVQEVGFALVLHALPALFWNEMPTSAHVLIPMLAVVRGSTTLSSPVLNYWLTCLSSTAASASTSAGFCLIAVVSCFVVNGALDPRDRRALSVCSKPRVSWRIMFVILTVFNSVATLAFVAVLAEEMFAEKREPDQFVVQLLPSAVLYFCSGPFVAVMIRWLPARGIMLAIANLLNVALLITLDYLPDNWLPYTFSLLAISNGIQCVLLHMHLVEAMSSRLRGRHDVIAARITAATFSVAVIGSFMLLPLISFVRSEGLPIFESKYPCILLNGVAFLTLLATIVKEFCTARGNAF